LSDHNERDAFLEFTNKNGIMTRPSWHLMNELLMFKNCVTDKLENAKAISSTLVSLPSSVIDE
jgi:perosamine synthetase